MMDVADVARVSRFFTICACNYLAHAAVLGRSVSATHPDVRLTVFLLDELQEKAAGLDHLDLVQADSLMTEDEWDHRRCFYDVMELATSIKPACFMHMHRAGAQFAVYLDPDILVLKPVNEVFAGLASGHEIILTPHLLTPLPADEKIPDDLSIMNSGIYNLGFAAFANTERSNAILQWWDRKLRTQGTSDLRAGTFTDQKWIDFIPAFESRTFVVRNPGYNVAYWNLHERTVRKDAAGWRVQFLGDAGHDIVFFHFSGYTPGIPALSRHENRFQTCPPGDTTRILADYAVHLADAGIERFGRYALPAPRFERGIGWDAVFRALYRETIRDKTDVGNPLKGEAFISYAAAKRRGDHLSSYLRTLMSMRPDLAVAYDDGRNVQGLAAWFSRSARAEIGRDPATLPFLNDDRADLGEIHDGVNYVGYLRSHLGIGEGARNSIAALRAVGVEVAARDISTNASSPTGHYSVAGDADHRYFPGAITILGVNADQTPWVLANQPAELRANFVIGCWAWETPEFPEQWCDRFDLVDEVWVASNFVAEAVRAKATVPVLVIPYMVSPPRVAPDRAWLRSCQPEVQEDEFVFLFVFDAASVPFRKNPEGAIAAFCKAFHVDEPVRLLIKTLNADRDPSLLGRLTKLAGGHRVTIWEEPLENLDRFRLLATADAFVSLHRAEGFGLSIAEAMAYGRPVVVTGWSGNVDFTNSENAAIVAYDLIATEREHLPYHKGTLWAEPKIDDAARQMRRVWQDTAWRSNISKKAAETVTVLLSPEAIGKVMKTRLDRLSVSVRHRCIQRSGAVVIRAADGPPQPVMPMGAVARSISLDILRRPMFYLVRAHRLPRVLFTLGIGHSLQLAAYNARSPRRVATNSSLLGSLLAKVARLLGKFGWRRASLRTSTQNLNRARVLPKSKAAADPPSSMS